MKHSLFEKLAFNPYPGRGIAIGRSEDGQCAVIVYFIMGRSENSRNRIFVPDGDGLKTEVFDRSKVTDLSLIIYSPVRVLGGTTVVTNGDQTDTVCRFLSEGKTFEDALRTRAFEPDAPNFTPRISGMVQRSGARFTYRMSILKTRDGGATCERAFFEYEFPAPGEARLLHTYETDGNPIPAYRGEPSCVRLSGNIDELSDKLWHSLDSKNKVSLFTRFIDLETGKEDTRIINKNKA